MTEDERKADDAVRAKAHNAERLQSEAMTMHAMFMCAAMAGGARPGDADKQAVQAAGLLKARFT